MFSPDDLRQIKKRGITEKTVKAQIETFKKSRFCLRLCSPSTPGNGIISIPEKEIDGILLNHQKSADEGRFVKFVPASGAASRMFKTLLWFRNSNDQLDREKIILRAQKGDNEAKKLVRFMEGIRNFAFFKDLKKVMDQDGLKTDDLIAKGTFRLILDYLLTPRGLNYAGLPKGLLKFHHYPEHSRTPLEEHLVEAAHYARDGEGICRIHFTLSSEDRKGVTRLLERTTPLYEKKYNVRFEMDFSVQKESTDTLAVDMDNNPFRDKKGELLFRPGGHGALIENLNETKGDIVYIKNIDNVVPDRLKLSTFLWKKILGGYLTKTQQKIFTCLKRLKKGEEEAEFVEECLKFARDQLFIVPPPGKQLEATEEKIEFLIKKLNRPLRVCGMVKNEGEPGGGPFWVKGKDGSLSPQIVEHAQVDLDSREQQDIWKAATHFNPVDIVCGIRNYQGRNFDLRHYVDREAVFISKKSKDGRDLKALELPGLWNGAMADWITIFVEVPIITFNPVKTINDLLRKEHQPG
ncbi:MAG: DUF4301 family protein [Thermoplasmata archaeon]|nr:DUF4301 family protein [Thermoplasmata archaeon]